MEIIEFSQNLGNVWRREQRDLEDRLKSELGGGINLEDLYNPKYPANLVAHAITAQRLLNNSTLEGKKVIELGFGTQPHMPLLTKYGANSIGIEIDERVVNMAKQRGYNAIAGDAANIDELLDRDYFADMIISIKFFDGATFSMGADSKFLNVGDIVASTNRLIESIKNGTYLDEEERYQKARTILEKLYNKTKSGGIHIHTTIEDEGFLVNKTDIEKMGYEVVCLNENNPSRIQFLTVLKKK